MPRIAAFASFAALGALLLAACSDDTPEPAQSGDTAAQAGDAETGDAETGGAPQADGVTVSPPQTVAEAVSGAWRGQAARARDAARNPVETIEFFGIDPSGTIVEIWPGGGWYTDILAPWIATHGGTYVAAWPSVAPGNERAAAFRARFLERFEGPLYGDATLVPFGPNSVSLMEAGTADAILTFRNVHNWMSAGFAEAAFASFHTALKPGGVLGVVEHRQPGSRVQDPRAATGYVQQDYVVSLAQEAGFELVGSSEINANRADTADHPFGVWTLPPVRRTSPFGEPADPDFDTAPYDAIGESDRMTLLFRKPGNVNVEDNEGESAAEAGDTDEGDDG